MGRGRGNLLLGWLELEGELCLCLLFPGLPLDLRGVEVPKSGKRGKKKGDGDGGVGGVEVCAGRRAWESESNKGQANPDSEPAKGDWGQSILPQLAGSWVSAINCLVLA